MVQLLRRVLTEREAAQLAGWRYPPPFDLYDSGVARGFLVRGPGGEGYHPVVDCDDRLVAFAVVGAEARVRGQQLDEGVVDVGMGVRPDATSRGIGTRLLPQVVALAVDLGARTAVRAAVAGFNERSLALCASAGFRFVREFPGPGNRPFRELVLPLARGTDLRAGCPG